MLQAVIVNSAIKPQVPFADMKARLSKLRTGGWLIGSEGSAVEIHFVYLIAGQEIFWYRKWISFDARHHQSLDSSICRCVF